ncbi:MAG: DUF6089 family protein [Chitinophagales bacterium]|nr:DUF6089 family protein [Chitinophagales bacterium]MDW8273662.1 DUF6089 family protein [Chitinophagales bacterium]
MSRAVIFILLCSCIFQSFAQNHEFGGFAGFGHYFGDLNPKFSFAMPGPAGGVFYRYNIKKRGAYRASVNLGMVEFRDDATNIPSSLQRNLSFRSNIIDITNLIEFNFLEYDKKAKRKWFTPYLATGFTLFFFNPKAYYRDRWIYLQPLGTEGQNDPDYSGVKKYNLYNFSIPAIFGFKFSVKSWNIAIEGGWRQTFTDYLDDVSGNYPAYVSMPGGSQGLAAQLSDRSREKGIEPIGKPGKQRGESPKTDAYLFAGITISYTILRIECPKPYGLR